jgi:hypothetical protein
MVTDARRDILPTSRLLSIPGVFRWSHRAGFWRASKRPRPQDWAALRRPAYHDRTGHCCHLHSLKKPGKSQTKRMRSVNERDKSSVFRDTDTNLTTFASRLLSLLVFSLSLFFACFPTCQAVGAIQSHPLQGWLRNEMAMTQGNLARWDGVRVQLANGARAEDKSAGCGCLAAEPHAFETFEA